MKLDKQRRTLIDETFEVLPNKKDGRRALSLPQKWKESGWTGIVFEEEASEDTIYLPVTDVGKVHLQ